MYKVLIFSVLFSMASLLEARELYVNINTGNDSVDYSQNTASNPWRTLGRAVWGSSSRSSRNSSQAAQAGDTVHVAPGVYATNQATGERYDPIYNPTNNGSSGAPITFKAEGRVVLESNTGGRGEPIIGALDRYYIVWDGFYIDENNVHTKSDTGPIVVWGAGDITLRNLEIRGKTAPWLDNHNAIRIEAARNVVVYNNRIHGNRRQSTDQNASALMLYGSDNVLIEHNEIYNSDGGIYAKADKPNGVMNTRLNIRLNKIYDNSTDAIVVGCVDGSDIVQNVLYNNRAGVTFMGNCSTTPRNIRVVNNTIANNWKASVRLLPSTQGYRGNIVKNNILTGSEHAFNGEGISDLSNVEVEHNLYDQHDNHAVISFNNYGFDSMKNQFQTDLSEPRSIYASPSFMNQTGADFRISAQSPAISHGIDVLDLNRNGLTRDSISLGAYIANDVIVGLLDGGGNYVAPPMAPIVH